MPRSRESRYFVLKELKDLSAESDNLAEQLPQISDLDPFFELIKETALKIKSCTSVKEIKAIKFPPDIKCFLNKNQQQEKNKISQTPGTQKEHVHAIKKISSGCKTTAKNVKNKCNLPEATFPTSEQKEIENKSTSVESCIKSNQATPLLPQISTPNVKIQELPVKSFSKINSCKSQNLLENHTPVMNRTFNKLINDTVINSASSHGSNKKLKIVKRDMRITRSASKENLHKNETSNRLINDTIMLNSASSHSSNQNLKIIESDMRITRSASKEKVETGGPCSQTRKRKSSSKKKEKSKRQKMEQSSKISATKTAQFKPLIKSNILKSSNSLVLGSKTPAVIVPTLKHNTPTVISKEKKLEEMQKKELKANENRKKVLAERQLKAEEQKKKREEKMEKALQKRLLIEKEKEQVEKMPDCKLSQAKVLSESVKKPVLKIRSKELNEQLVSEAIAASKKNDHVVDKTPAKKVSRDSETYDLTPAPDSSTYDFSDDEDKPSGKPIPSWAQGIQLKSALIHQFYNPPDANKIFGSYITPPDLCELFGVKKKIYLKRTSSAVWNSTPK